MSKNEMGITAVDAVILPSTEITQLAISLSEQLRKTSPIVLNNHNYFPHMTLAMGYVKDIEKTKETVRQIFEINGPLQITFTDVTRSPQPFEGYCFWHLIAEPNPSLQKLHEQLVAELPFVDVENPTSELFLPESDGIIVPNVYNYVGVFRTQHSGEKYWPHITLGAGPENALQKPSSLPITITVGSIALCRLGNFCTCRFVL